MDALSTAERNKLAAKYGLILGLIYIVLNTIANMTVNYTVYFYGVFIFINYVIYFILLGILAKRIRNANGGFIEFKEIFGAVFVMLLIGGFLSYLYNYIYVNFIDAEFTEKIVAVAKQQMEKMAAQDESIEKAMESLDESTAKSQQFNVLSFLGTIVRDSLFGLIVCAIVKKSKPVFE